MHGGEKRLLKRWRAKKEGKKKKCCRCFGKREGKKAPEKKKRVNPGCLGREGVELQKKKKKVEARGGGKK